MAQHAPNEPIDLGEESIAVTVDGKQLDALARVTMVFAPDVQLRFSAHSDHMGFAFAWFGPDKEDPKLTLNGRHVSFGAICLSMQVSSSGSEAVLIPKTSVITVTKPAADLQTATFQLFNFPDFRNVVQDVRQSTLAGLDAFTLKADGWSVVLATVGEPKERYDQLKKTGGFCLTHTGAITLDDGSCFSSEQLEDLLCCLHHFLSFALGRWVGPALPVGFDADGNRRFEQWGMSWATSGPWKAGLSWVDPHNGHVLTAVFPGFVALWKHQLWGNVLRTAIYWYVGANTRGEGIGVDTGLILAQTALEQLAWTYCVKDRKLVSEEAFGKRGLSAANKLRLLTTSLGIPAELPATCRALGARRGRKFRDIADAITTVRNAIVHPDNDEILLRESYFEACTLALWLLDLILLRLCRYEGSYANRLEVQRFVGEVEPVPWSLSPPI